jgi:hypothetical protein
VQETTSSYYPARNPYRNQGVEICARPTTNGILGGDSEKCIYKSWKPPRT